VDRIFLLKATVGVACLRTRFLQLISQDEQGRAKFEMSGRADRVDEGLRQSFRGGDTIAE
jgi:hypothetical protein